MKTTVKQNLEEILSKKAWEKIKNNKKVIEMISEKINKPGLYGLDVEDVNKTIEAGKNCKINIYETSSKSFQDTDTQFAKDAVSAILLFDVPENTTLHQINTFSEKICKNSPKMKHEIWQAHEQGEILNIKAILFEG